MCLALVGAAISAAGTLASASAQSASYKAQAQYAQRQALMERQKGAYEAARQNDRTTRQLANMRGQYLSSGIGLSGSAADVISDSATQASLDEQAIKYSAQVQSDNYTFESKLARQNASNSMAGGFIGAAGNLVGGLAQQMNINANRTMVTNPYLAAGA
jgi:hypothetical protein